MSDKATHVKVAQNVANLSLGEVFSPEFWVSFWRNASSGIITAAGQILLILFLFITVRFALFKVIDRILVPMANKETNGEEAVAGRASRIWTLQGLVKSVAAYALGFIAGIMILRALGVDPIPALTTAGVAALAIGFGAQLLVRDVITGFFILLENQYAVGEYVTIGGITGTVEEIGMRITRLRDDVGKLVILANGTINQVINHSRGSLVTYIDVSIPASSDIQKAIAVLNEVGKAGTKDKKLVVSPFKVDGVAAMDSTKVTLRMSGRVAPMKQDEVTMDLRSRIRQKLIDEEIGIV